MTAVHFRFERAMSASVFRATCFVGVISLAITAHGQQGKVDIPNPDPELERAALQLADGFEINLFVADPKIVNPVQMNFDPHGRLWVTSTTAYPQVRPNEEPNDKILVVEDVDGDGRADKTTVFAEGLLIPHGVLPGDGGVYVAASTELLHLSDTDGDGKADHTRVVLSGFGTEDAHHMLHTLRWGPDGMLYMNQSVYIHSHIETRYGVRTMNGAGIWQYRPETMRLEVYTRGEINPWGHHFDRFGQSLATDGAGSDGIHYVFPGFKGHHSPAFKRHLRGLNPGEKPKYCGLEVVSGRHFPREWRGNLITNDFRAHRVCRFVLSEQQSGFAAREMEELIKTSHAAFRPVDVKMGPDGALYIADWYNPIIDHGEIDFRDPRRDRSHGRIWRVTAKGRPLVPRPQLVDAPTAVVLDSLKLPEQFSRLQAKRVLKDRGAKQVLPELTAWIAGLDPKDPELEHHLLEALWTHESLNQTSIQLLRRLLVAKDHRVRAAATRVIYHRHELLPDALTLLARQIADQHPRVRLEALHALSRIPDARSCEIAMRALDRPTDRFIQFALWSTARAVEHYWLPRFKLGEITFDGNVDHLTFALEAIESDEVVELLLHQLNEGRIGVERRMAVFETVALLGDADALNALFVMARNPETRISYKVAILQALARAGVRRGLRPSVNLQPLLKLLEHDSSAVRVAALNVAAVWRLEPAIAIAAQMVSDASADPHERLSAIDTLASLGGEQAKGLLAMTAKKAADPQVSMRCVAGLTRLDLQVAAARAVVLLKTLPRRADPTSMVEAFLAQKNGPSVLSQSLAGEQLPKDTAKLVLRAVRSSGAEHRELVAALSSAGKLTEKSWKFSPSQLQAFITEVRERGNPQRGETIYRRADLGCVKCHAISGAGGRVGPDLAAIGASAPVDYLIQSLLEPNKKIKENYDTLVVLTDEGRIISGIKVSENDDELILWTADNRKVRIVSDSIEGQKKGNSLMPVDLVEPLARDELIDLVRFLSELGKPGPYAISTRRFIRQFEVLPPSERNQAVLSRVGVAATRADTELNWQPFIARVSGDFSVADLPSLKVSGDVATYAFLRFRIKMPAAGKGKLLLSSSKGLSAWVDGDPVPVAKEMPIESSQRPQTVVLAIRPEKLDVLRIEFIDSAASP